MKTSHSISAFQRRCKEEATGNAAGNEESVMLPQRLVDFWSCTAGISLYVLLLSIVLYQIVASRNISGAALP